MWYKQLTNTNLHVSSLCLGTVNYGTSTPTAECLSQLDRFAEAGGNFLDTAHVYGDWTEGPKAKSERLIGQWMQRNNTRKSMIISTKGAHPRLETMDISRVTPQAIRSDLQESLEYLGTDSIDLYFLHRDDPLIPVDEIIDLLDELQAEGLIRYYGCSNWTLARIWEAARYAAKKQSTGLLCNQLMWSLADVRQSALKDPSMIPMDADAYAYHVQSSMNVMAYTSLAHGYFSRKKAGSPLPRTMLERYDTPTNQAIYKQLLQYEQQTGRTVTAMSLQYLMAHPFGSVPIASFSKMPQLESAIEACVEKPDPAIVQTLHSMKSFISSQPIP